MMSDLVHISLSDIVLHAPGNEEHVSIIHNLSGDISRGAITAIIGPSGSGKSTTLRLMNGLLEPDSGEIRLSGVPYRQIPPRQLRRRVGLVFQEPTLLPGTVATNLQYPFQLMGKLPPDWAVSARYWLKQVNLDPTRVWERDVAEFSLGEKQRIALVRTLLTDPEVLLLDEPTASLDPGNTSFIIQIVQRWNREKHITVVWVTHTLDVARQVADRVWVLRGGHLLEEGDAATVLDHPHHEETRRFVNGDAI